MSYPRNAWYVAGWSDDIESSRPFPISILGERIVVWRSESGALHAIEDRCVHRLAPLSLGRCEGENLRCMYHGLLYNGDGAVVEIPGQDLVPAKAKVARYAVADRHSWIWIWMGDLDDADEALIPPAVGFDDPDWILGRSHLDYEAEARLINDNLLDFSHLTYVHRNSFRAGEEFAQTLPEISPLERGVRFTRWMENSKGQTGRPAQTPVDAWMCTDFLAPGVLLMYNASFPAGTARACNYGEPDRSNAVSGVTFTSQAVTPMSDKTARYFFSWGPHRAHGDEKLRDFLMDLAGRAFGEDKEMIEAQQRVLDDTPDARVMPTQHDRGVTIYNGVVERLNREADAEASGAREAST